MISSQSCAVHGTDWIWTCVCLTPKCVLILQPKKIFHLWFQWARTKEICVYLWPEQNRSALGSQHRMEKAVRGWLYDAKANTQGSASNSSLWVSLRTTQGYSRTCPYHAIKIAHAWNLIPCWAVGSRRSQAQSLDPGFRALNKSCSRGKCASPEPAPAAVSLLDSSSYWTLVHFLFHEAQFKPSQEGIDPC